MTSIPPTTDRDPGFAPPSPVRRMIGRITPLEMIVAGVIAAILLVLVLLEPEILEAPFENERTLLFTVGGTALAAVAFVAMLWLRVPPVVRVIVLVVPFAIVNWWLLSPYFIDDVVDEEFSTSISAQLAAPDAGAAPDTIPTTPPLQVEPIVPETAPAADAAAAQDQPAATDPAPVPEEQPAGDAPLVAEEQPVAESVPPVVEEQPAAPVQPAAEPEPAAPAPANGPVLLGAGQFVGLAGHSGTGDAGIFQNPDGSLVLRFENFDIQNGPDLEVYLVPGAGQASIPAGSIHLGALKGNIGDQNYVLPPGTQLAPGAYTALVWCEAFSVEFVGATISV